MIKNVLVVGGAGYIGSHTVKRFAQENYNVIIFDNLSMGFEILARYGELIVGDLKNIDSIDAVFKKYDIEVVLHFAAFAYVGESVVNPKKYYENNVKNTLNLLDSMLRFNIKKIIFSSTCAVFGLPKYLPICEEHPKNPINPYGKSKLMVEEILEDFNKAYGLQYVILRYFNAAGADLDGELGEMHDPETHLIPIAIDAAHNEKHTLHVYGDTYATEDGSCVRDYIHVNDLAGAHIKAYEYMNNNVISNTFNLGSGKAYSVLEVIKAIEKVSSKKLPYIIEPKRTGDPDKLISSSKKANSILNWKPEVSDIETIIKSALKWQLR